MTKQFAPGREQDPLATAVHEADDAELVAQTRRDRSAFSPLYARYADRVFRYCFRRLGSREAAEDATAAVFTNARAGLHGFRGGSFAAWLFAIAHNICLNASRRRAELPLAVVDDWLIRDGNATPEEAALAAEERQTLHDLLSALSPDQRRVVELRLAGLTGAEIAETMDRSVAAVKMLQVRALARMRAIAATELTERTEDARPRPRTG